MTGWVEKASAVAGVATATRAARANQQHVVWGISASYSSTDVELVQIKDGSTVVWEDYVYDSLNVVFPKGLSITNGAACSAVLAAGAGTGKVNLHGTT